MLSHVIPCYPMLSHIIPYYPILSHSIPCYPILSHIIQGGAGVLPSTVSSTVDVHQVAIHIAREQLKCDCLPRRLAPWGFLSHGDGVEYHQPAWFNGLVGKNYRKAPYFMGKSMVSCRFSLKPIH